MENQNISVATLDQARVDFINDVTHKTTHSTEEAATTFTSFVGLIEKQALVYRLTQYRCAVFYDKKTATLRAVWITPTVSYEYTPTRSVESRWCASAAHTDAAGVAADPYSALHELTLCLGERLDKTVKALDAVKIAVGQARQALN